MTQAPRRDTAEVLSDGALAALVRRGGLVDVDVATWSVSSAKHGCGVANLLRGDDAATFWQSDGGLPHTAHARLARLTAVTLVCVRLDHAADESYTPHVMHVRAGTHDGDVAEVATAKVHQPNGWVVIAVGDAAGGASATAPSPSSLAAALWCTQLAVVFAENHHNGRDCHVRGVRLLGPRRGAAATATTASTSDDAPLR